MIRGDRDPTHEVFRGYRSSASSRSADARTHVHVARGPPPQTGPIPSGDTRPDAGVFFSDRCLAEAVFQAAAASGVKRGQLCINFPRC